MTCVRVAMVGVLAAVGGASCGSEGGSSGSLTADAGVDGIGQDSIGLDSIGLDSVDQVPEAKAPDVQLFENPYPGLPRWCKGATHMHTTASDGVNSADEMIAAYAAHGYDFVFITDHDKRTIPQGATPIQVFPGEEVSTDWGHANAFGINSELPKIANQQDAIAAATAAGGLMQRNHPSRQGNTTRERLDSWSGLWGLELRNQLNLGVADNDRLLWDSQLSQGRHIWGTFGDDAHDIGVVARGWIMVNTADASCAQSAVLDAMRAGAFYMSEGPTMSITAQGDTIGVSTDAAGATIAWYGKDLQLLRQSTSSTASYTATGGELFVRIEILDSSGRHAWSQPLFLRH